MFPRECIVATDRHAIRPLRCTQLSGRGSGSRGSVHIDTTRAAPHESVTHMHVKALRTSCLQRLQHSPSSSLDRDGNVDVLLRSKLAIAVPMTPNPATYRRYPGFLLTAPTLLEQLDQLSPYNQALTQTRCIDRAQRAKLVLSTGRLSRFSFAVDSRFREQNPSVAFPDHGVPSCVILVTP